MKYWNNFIQFSKRYQLASCIVIFVLQNTLAQQQKPDELLQLLNKSDRGTARVDLLLKLADYYVETEWNYSNKIKVDSALSYLQEAKKISDSVRSKGHMYETLRKFGNYYFRCDKTDSASYYYTKLILLQRKAGEKENEAINWQLFASRTPFLENFLDTIVFRYQQAFNIYKELENFERQAELSGLIGEMLIAKGKLFEAEHSLLEALGLQKSKSLKNIYFTYWQLSRLHRNKGNYDKAIEYGLKSIEEVKSISNQLAEAIYNDGVGRLYADIGQHHLAFRFFYTALEILAVKTTSNLQDKNEQYDIINQMVLSFLQLGKPREALALLERTEKTNPPDNDYTKLIYLVSMGNCNKGLRKFNASEHYYEQALVIAGRTGQMVEASSILLLLTKLHVSCSRYDQAEKSILRLLNQPKNLATKIYQSETNLLQFKIDSATGNYMSAIRHFQKHKELNDSVFTIEKARQLEELQVQYQTVKNKQEILALQDKAKLQEAAVLKENFEKKITLAGVALLITILMLSLRAYHIKQRTNRQLELKQEQVNQTNLSLQRMVQEKDWLVKEIHHRVKNNLHTIISLLDSQTAYLLNSGEKNAIRDSQRRIQAMSLLHQKLYLSSDINSVGMVFYIQELVGYLKESFMIEERIQFKLDIEPIVLDVSPAVSLALILNESITNALKYAFPGDRPGVISVVLKGDSPRCYRLSVMDNGIGLPVKFDFQSHASLGLNLIQGLAEDIDGNLSILSEEGTSISIVFPKIMDDKANIKGQLSKAE